MLLFFIRIFSKFNFFHCSGMGTLCEKVEERERITTHIYSSIIHIERVISCATNKNRLETFHRPVVSLIANVNQFSHIDDKQMICEHQNIEKKDGKQQNSNHTHTHSHCNNKNHHKEPKTTHFVKLLR